MQLRASTKLVIGVFAVVLVSFAGLYGYQKFGTPASSSPSTTSSSSSSSSGSSSGTSAAGSTAKTYTLADVARHATTSDCWMAISGSVYNVTDYAASHQGGTIIYEGCGKDATQLFATQGGEGRGHSSRAYDDLAQLKIGTLTP